ncbi:uncharacterized protein C8orf74 homolog [Oryzias latipes]|uniref:uncharacterized protein C8orf74 homolog n=1 Tax=Oryzias latipes TaxID=8090 RepID=UPI0002A4C843|nr:uncharacterized protein C8orf74 homolog [Oryzias latipes]
METLTNIEMAAIAKLERDAGVHRLSSHFLWSEFNDERQTFHQEFVYDAAMLAIDSGFSPANVTQSAMLARDIYPQLEELDLNKFLTLLKGALRRCLPSLTPVQQHKFIQYFTDFWVERRKLFKAAVGGATTQTVQRLQLEVELPPIPCPLVQGSEVLSEPDPQLTSSQLSEEEEEEEVLKALQDQQVTLGEAGVPKGLQRSKRAAQKRL